MSLLISLLVVPIAILVKKRLNWYLVSTGGSLIERCRDRQRRYNELQKPTFRLLDRNIQSMFYVCPILIICGSGIRISFTSTYLAGFLLLLTIPGVVIFVWVINIDTSRPLSETPASTTPPSLQRNESNMTAALPTTTTTAGGCLCEHLASLLAKMGHHFHHPSLPTVRPTPQEPVSWSATLRSLWESVQCKILHVALHLPQTPPSPTIQDTTPNSTATSPWLVPTTKDTFWKANAGDAECVSWALRNLTNPEALYAATRLTAIVWWFMAGLNVELGCSLITSTLKMCFDSTGKIYPQSRDRAYHSAQAILWIHICAMCVSEEFAQKYPLPTIPHDATSVDDDLGHLLGMYAGLGTHEILTHMYYTVSGLTPAYLEWSWNGLLHLCWARQSVSGIYDSIIDHHDGGDWGTVPLNTVLSCLLIWCIFLGQSVDKEMLEVQNKWYVISYLPPSSHSLFLPVIT